MSGPEKNQDQGQGQDDQQVVEHLIALWQRQRVVNAIQRSVEQTRALREQLMNLQPSELDENGLPITGDHGPTLGK